MSAVTVLPSENGAFHDAIEHASRLDKLVLQPRMGLSDPVAMRRGLRAVAHANAATVGTITLDSYTRVGKHDLAGAAVRNGEHLNGYPLIAHGSARTRAVLEGIQGPAFPVQVRHGTALPEELFKAMVIAGFDATEGGPVSYCLPYSRVPLREAVAAWERCSQLAAEAATNGSPLHIETFGGCMLGQLCPPGLLVALSVLEAIFFRYHGVRSLSLSYAQQSNLGQDLAAVQALRRLTRRYIRDAGTHTVIYTFMGVYPRTVVGAFRLLERSIVLARRSGAERLIVKTHAEAHRIPTIAENVTALEFADAVARRYGPGDPGQAYGEVEGEAEEIEDEARSIVEAVLELHDDPGKALIEAFRRGLLDVPYCLHGDNANVSRAQVRPDGRLAWVDAGRMPVKVDKGRTWLRAERFLSMLHHNQRVFDRQALTGDVRSLGISA